MMRYGFSTSPYVKQTTLLKSTDRTERPIMVTNLAASVSTAQSATVEGKVRA